MLTDLDAEPELGVSIWAPDRDADLESDAGRFR